MEDSGRVLIDKAVLMLKVNAVIEDAIMHGGDWGGPYYSEPERLKESVSALAEEIGCGWEWEKDVDLIGMLRKAGDFKWAKHYEEEEGRGIRLVPKSDGDGGGSE